MKVNLPGHDFLRTSGGSSPDSWSNFWKSCFCLFFRAWWSLILFRIASLAPFFESNLISRFSSNNSSSSLSYLSPRRASRNFDFNDLRVESLAKYRLRSSSIFYQPFPQKKRNWYLKNFWTLWQKSKVLVQFDLRDLLFAVTFVASPAEGRYFSFVEFLLRIVEVQAVDFQGIEASHFDFPFRCHRDYFRTYFAMAVVFCP